MKFLIQSIVFWGSVSFVVGSCASHEVNNAVTLSVTPPSMNPSPTPAGNQIQLSPKYITRSVQETVLKKFTPIDGMTLIGSRTIPIPRSELLEQFPSDLVQSLQDRNKATAEVVGPFDVYAKIKTVNVNGKLNDFLTRSEKQFPGAIGLVLFSSVGFTRIPNETLVYVEFYKFDGSQQSFFLFSKYDAADNQLEHKWTEIPMSNVNH